MRSELKRLTNIMLGMFMVLVLISGMAKTVQAETSTTGVTLDEASAEVQVGETAELNSGVSPDDADGAVIQNSSDTNAASVDGGAVAGMSDGTAEITADEVNGTEDTSDDKTASSALKLSINAYSYGLSVGGIDVTSENKGNITGGDTVTASYDNKSNTLTLNNYTYNGSVGAVRYDGGNDTLNIVLIGTNTITCTGDSSRAIVSGGSLSFSGEGSLTASAVSYGILADREIEIRGGTIHAEGEYGILNASENIIISGGTVEAVGTSAGIYSSDGLIKISGGTVTANGNGANGDGLYSPYEIDMTGGTVTANGGRYGIYAPAAIISKGLHLLMAKGDTQAFSGLISAPGFNGEADWGQHVVTKEISFSDDPVQLSYKKIALAAPLKYIYDLYAQYYSHNEIIDTTKNDIIVDRFNVWGGDVYVRIAEPHSVRTYRYSDHNSFEDFVTGKIPVDPDNPEYSEYTEYTKLLWEETFTLPAGGYYKLYRRSYGDGVYFTFQPYDSAAGVYVTLNKSDISMHVGEVVKLTAAVRNYDPTEDTRLYWDVYGDKDAVVLYADYNCTRELGSGTFDTHFVYAKAEKEGNASVAATSSNSVGATCNIKISANAETQSGSSKSGSQSGSSKSGSQSSSATSGSQSGSSKSGSQSSSATSGSQSGSATSDDTVSISGLSAEPALTTDSAVSESLKTENESVSEQTETPEKKNGVAIPALLVTTAVAAGAAALKLLKKVI